MARAAGPAPVTGPTIRDYLNRDRPSLWVLISAHHDLNSIYTLPSSRVHSLSPSLSHTHTHTYHYMYSLNSCSIHTIIYREEATDIIKAATKKVGSGALAAWEEEQNDVMLSTPQLTTVILCLYVLFMQAL